MATPASKFSSDSATPKLVKRASSDKSGDNAAKAILTAIDKSQAVVEFLPDGTIISANSIFLNAMGYTLAEVKDQHHGIFVESTEKQGLAYRMFWQSLARGEFQSGEFKRIGKNGNDVWIQGSYSPILDGDGAVCKVIKFAVDITEQKRLAANFKSQIEAIDKSQAVIEFQLDGTIVGANENFLKTVGYSLAEVKGRHHSIFVDKEERLSPEYREFWECLARGEHQSGQFRRISKSNSEIWIQGAYNPIFDASGRVSKIIKFATDITDQKRLAANFKSQIEAIDKSQAVIEFQLDGTILTANNNFLDAMGYTLAEVRGQHHSIFIEKEERQSAAYREFWQSLGRGEYRSGEYKRIGKSGEDVWIQGSYNPIFDANGKAYKVVKFATNVTEQKSLNANFQSQIEAISKSQAVIEFMLDGTIVGANENFLRTMGYSLSEIKGRHHSVFVDKEERLSPQYREFWNGLGRGEYQSGEFKRVGKAGNEIWIHGSYNPIFDATGKAYKVVKFATDITEQKRRTADFQGQIEAISKSQAIIEFNLDGTIITANENFLRTMGYTMSEIQDQYHGMFVDKTEKETSDYRDFWFRLGRGEFQSGTYRRIAKGGKEVWIEGSYNPIYDLSGKPYKVVKYAHDVTGQIKAKRDNEQMQADERQRTADLEEKVSSILTVVKSARDGDLTQTITVEGGDPIGQMGMALRSFLSDLRQSITGISVASKGLGTASQDLSTISEQMASNAEETATQAAVVSTASDEVSRNVTVVAAGSEEMQVSIREISKSANESARVAHNAVAAANATNETIAKLGQSSREIGKVVKVITSIAQQTNLLALNATIEAARAGEAGKGFAVVANEVKELAKETAKATEEIGQKIDAIQNDTTKAVQAIEEISSIINQINDVSNTIASAVEEQTATTNEIARSVTDASRGVSDIATNIAGVATAAQSTTSGAAGTQIAAKTLQGMASQLQDLVSRFTV